MFYVLPFVKLDINYIVAKAAAVFYAYDTSFAMTFISELFKSINKVLVYMQYTNLLVPTYYLTRWLDYDKFPLSRLPIKQNASEKQMTGW